jgi:hypothetical protein
VQRWFRALGDLIDTGRAVVDVGSDHYQLATAPPTPSRPRRRERPLPPNDHPRPLRGLLRRWARKHAPFGIASCDSKATLEELEHTDPLVWLYAVAQMAVFVRHDPDTQVTTICSPRRMQR